MSTDLVPFVGKHPVAMKGGLIHWVTEATAERVKEALSTQTAHRFMKLTELGIVINSSEVEGVYTMAEYENLCKVRQGMWQCSYKGWHNKGKVECQCAKDFARRREEKRREREQAEENKPLTPEQKANMLKRMKEIGDGMRVKNAPPTPVAAEQEEDGMPDFTD